MPRGITPIRVRRRQSDAKWRASVAMCYNIMKNVIPNQKVLGRRKVSKALTLKETERHIVNLERKLRELIEEKAPGCGKSVMISDEKGNVRCANFEDIKKDFAVKQVSFFASNTGSGKKRYNIPADIEASLVNLSKQTCQLFVVNRADSKAGPAPAPQPRKPLADKGQARKDIFQRLGQNNHSTPRKKTPQFKLKKGSLGSNFGPQIRCSSAAITPPKYPGQIDPTTGDLCTTAGSTGKQYNRLATGLTSPLIISQETLSSPGFTPVKLPVDFERGDPLLSAQDTPATSFGSPFSFFSPVIDDNPNLLCTESIDTLDIETEPLGLTPGTLSLVNEELASSTIRPEQSLGEKPKCRRRLDVSYLSKDQDQTVPNFEQESKLDSFFLFYNHHTNNIEDTNGGHSDRSVAMPNMFEELEAEKPGRFTSLTSIGDYTNDLVPFDLEPYTRPMFKDWKMKAVAGEDVEYKDHSQEVPCLNLDFPSQLCPIPGELGLVPEYEDLGIIYGKDSKEDLFTFKLNTTENEDFHEASQVVPSF